MHSNVQIISPHLFSMWFVEYVFQDEYMLQIANIDVEPSIRFVSLIEYIKYVQAC